MAARGFVLALLGALAANAGAQEIPAGAQHCSLSAPPEAAAKGFRSGGQPARLFPPHPGEHYTGCQWIWIAWGTPGTWDYWAATYYERGVPKIQRVRYPPLPVQPTIQRCVYDADGRARKLVDGNDWRLDCPGVSELQELLRLTPKQDGIWDFL
jgi:hypothetical protein